MPAIGGEPTRLTSDGLDPRFSPDGQWIAFWVGVHSSSILTGSGGGRLYLVPAGGGQPRRIGADLEYATIPIWSSDSKHLLAYAFGHGDWYIISTDGAPSRPTGIFGALKRQGFSISLNRIPRLSQWVRGSILFSAVHGDAVNAWRMPVSDDGRSTGPAERLTSGTTLEASPLLTPAGKLIFASLNLAFSVWSLPVDADRATVTGELKQVAGSPIAAQPSISEDGRTLAFVMRDSPSGAHKVGASAVTPLLDEPFHVHVQDLSTGRETSIPKSGPAQFSPRLSRDGKWLAYATAGQNHPVIDWGMIANWAPHIIQGSEGPGGWSLDDKRLLFENDVEPGEIYVLDIPSGRKSLLLAKSGYSLFQATFSRDNRAVSMVGCGPEGPVRRLECRIFVVPLKIDGTAEANTWIAIDHRSAWDDKPRWSPNGNLIYFISDRDGQFCLWAQRIESRSKRPIGIPFPVCHFHNARLDLINAGTGAFDDGVARDKIVMALGELTGNIWTLGR